MNIGILGSGDVGRRLGDGLIAFGHNHGQEKAAAGTFAEAASFGDVLILIHC